MATNNGTTPTKNAAKGAKTATPWGLATLIERVSVPQRAGEKRFSCLVELLESGRGEQLIRIAYGTGGAARRGPVTLRASDLDRLRDALRKAPALADAIGLREVA